jgi:probable rRNA maturation factor
LSKRPAARRSASPLPARGEREKRRPARKQRAENKIQIDVVARSAHWRKRPTAKTIVKKAVLAAAEAVSTPPAELAIVLGDDSGIQALNRDWRGKNAPTNVLSFPAARPGARPGKTRPASPYLGDIVIAYQTVAREAAAEGKPFNHHLAHLAVHGFLHLLGYGHENDRDAQTMERLERTILKRLAIPDPYAAT